MFIFRQTVIEICKTFLVSIVCSIVFAFLIYRESALPYAFVCLVLNGAAFVLFLYLFYRNLFRLYENSFTLSEYFVPAILATVVYIMVTLYFYVKRFIFYMWFFLPTRFLEPWLNSSFAYLSVVVAYAAMAIMIAITPILSNKKG